MQDIKQWPVKVSYSTQYCLVNADCKTEIEVWLQFMCKLSYTYTSAIDE